MSSGKNIDRRHAAHRQKQSRAREARGHQGVLGMGGAASGASTGGGISPQRATTLERLGMRMLAPPGNPMRPGAPAPQLSTAGQNPMVAQFQQMFGVDYQTALQMLSMRSG